MPVRTAIHVVRSFVRPPVSVDGRRWTPHALTVRTALSLGVFGWLGTLWSWLDHGEAATTTAGFYVALAVGVTGTLAFAITAVLPEIARMYALGWRDRENVMCSACPLRKAAEEAAAAAAEPVRHQSPVR